MSLIPSPSSDMPVTRATIARPGNSDVHQAPVPTSVIARLMSKPHSAVRSPGPCPRNPSPASVRTASAALTVKITGTDWRTLAAT